MRGRVLWILLETCLDQVSQRSQGVAITKCHILIRNPDPEPALEELDDLEYTGRVDDPGGDQWSIVEQTFFAALAEPIGHERANLSEDGRLAG